MRTTILRFAGVSLCFLAGIAGCHSRSPVEQLPAWQDSGDTVVTPHSADPALNVDFTLSTADDPSNKDGSANAKPDNPRIAKFAELDADHDGHLTLAEFSVGRKPKEAEKWFQRRDVDGDGFTSLAEFVPPMPLSTPVPGTKPKEKTGDESLPPSTPSLND